MNINIPVLIAYAVPYLMMLYAIHVGWMMPNIRANPHYFWAHHAGTGLLGAVQWAGRWNGIWKSWWAYMVYDDIHQHWRLAGHAEGPMLSACRYGLALIFGDAEPAVRAAELFAAPLFAADRVLDIFFNRYGASPIHLLPHWVGYYDLKYDFAQWVKQYISAALGMTIERL